MISDRGIFDFVIPLKVHLLIVFDFLTSIINSSFPLNDICVSVQRQPFLQSNVCNLQSLVFEAT